MDAQDRQKHNELSQKWVKNNPEKRRLIAQKYYLKHRAKIIAKRKANQKKINAVASLRSRTREKIDINYKLGRRLRHRLYLALKNNFKYSSALEHLGCSLDELKNHLSNQFQSGMTWDNYGDWHIDHVRPCASFDLKDLQQQKECFHFSNLQPLWAIDNIKKRDKILLA